MKGETKNYTNYTQTIHSPDYQHVSLCIVCAQTIHKLYTKPYTRPHKPYTATIHSVLWTRNVRNVQKLMRDLRNNFPYTLFPQKDFLHRFLFEKYKTWRSYLHSKGKHAPPSPVWKTGACVRMKCLKSDFGVFVSHGGHGGGGAFAWRRYVFVGLFHLYLSTFRIVELVL